MSEKVIERASELINAKAGYIGGGMEGCAVISLIDEDGYPTSSTFTIAKADGIRWITLATDPDSNKARRIAKDGRASVCLSSSEYNINLVGTVEVVTDLDVKKENWFEPMAGHWSGADDPRFHVLRFSAERYSILFADDGSEAEGVLTEE